MRLTDTKISRVEVLYSDTQKCSSTAEQRISKLSTVHIKYGIVSLRAIWRRIDNVFYRKISSR